MSIYIRIAIIVALILLILLFGFQSIWVAGGSASGIMNQTGLQRMRAQMITKDVFVLAYRPLSEHAQAVSELQNVLPAWEHTQNGLKIGDSALQLPTHVPENIQQLLVQAQSDYIAIDTAVRVIIAYPDKIPDPIQVTIIQSHEHSYTLTMSQVVVLWQQRIDGAFVHIYWIESFLVACIAALLIYVWLAKSKAIHRIDSTT